MRTEVTPRHDVQSSPNSGSDFSNAHLNCDVIMKGGVTSGIVYPTAICELAKTYRFKNIGGTSAGAIAAAIAAAAEYQRTSTQAKPSEHGFNELKALPSTLGKLGLENLFVPQLKTRSLFKLG